MHVTLSIPKEFRGAITVFEDAKSSNQLSVSPDDTVIVPVPPSDELHVQSIPFSQSDWTSYDAQWSDGSTIPDGRIGQSEPDTTYFYYMFLPNKNPRAEYFFVGTPAEKDQFLQKATWTSL